MQPFIYENGQWYFRPQGADVSVPLTEDQVNEAEEKFRFRFKLAFVGMWLIFLPVSAWATAQVVFYDKPATYLLTIIPAYLAGFYFMLWATKSASRDIRGRMWDLEVEKHAGEPDTAPKSSWHNVPPRKVIVQRTWLLWAAFIASSALSGWDYRNNVRALNGVTVAATVIRSDDQDAHKCHVDYDYTWKGVHHSDGTLDCKLMDRHPVGSTIDIKIDPERPGHSMMPNASPWPPEIILPIFLAPILLFLAVAL